MKKRGRSNTEIKYDRKKVAAATKKKSKPFKKSGSLWVEEAIVSEIQQDDSLRSRRLKY